MQRQRNAGRYSITVASPNGGENLQVGERYIISWTSTSTMAFPTSSKLQITLLKSDSMAEIIYSRYSQPLPEILYGMSHLNLFGFYGKAENIK